MALESMSRKRFLLNLKNSTFHYRYILERVQQEMRLISLHTVPTEYTGESDPGLRKLKLVAKPVQTAKAMDCREEFSVADNRDFGIRANKKE